MICTKSFYESYEIAINSETAKKRCGNFKFVCDVCMRDFEARKTATPDIGDAPINKNDDKDCQVNINSMLDDFKSHLLRSVNDSLDQKLKGINDVFDDKLKQLVNKLPDQQSIVELSEKVTNATTLQKPLFSGAAATSSNPNELSSDNDDLIVTRSVNPWKDENRINNIRRDMRSVTNPIYITE